MSEKRASGKGGFRPGSGRPATIAPEIERVTLRLSVETIASLASEAARSGRPLAEVAREILDRAAKRLDGKTKSSA